MTMGTNKIITGLDIGSKSIKAVVGQLDMQGKLKVLGMAAVPAEGVSSTGITNIGKTIQAIQRAIRDVSQAANVDIKSVNASIPGRYTRSAFHRNGISRTSADGEITQEDVDQLNQAMYQITPPQGHDIVGIIPKSYTVDYEEGIKDPVGMSGTRLEGLFHVVTTQTNVVTNLQKCLERAGISINNLIAPPLAAGLAVLTPEEKQAGVCLIDIGEHLTGVNIYQNGWLQHMGLIPFAGNSITKDIAQAFMLMENQAEELKIKLGRAYEDPSRNEVVIMPSQYKRPEKEIFLSVIDRIIEARIEEIVVQVHQEIIKAGFSSKLPGGIVITGGSAQLAYLDKLFSYMTSYDTRLGYPYEVLSTKTTLTPNIEFATAIGLILIGYKPFGLYAQSQSNTVRGNPKQEVKRKKRQKSGWGGFFRSIFS